MIDMKADDCDGGGGDDHSDEDSTTTTCIHVTVNETVAATMTVTVGDRDRSSTRPERTARVNERRSSDFLKGAWLRKVPGYFPTHLYSFNALKRLSPTIFGGGETPIYLLLLRNHSAVFRTFYHFVWQESSLLVTL